MAMVESLLIGGALVGVAMFGFLVGFESALRTSRERMTRLERQPGEPRKAVQQCTPIVMVSTAATTAAERN